MFHPLEKRLARGWVGRIDGEHLVQLAAQTLQAFFSGGGKAREHAVYPLAAVRMLAPVLHPPAVRVFQDQYAFAFANPTAIVGPDAAVESNTSSNRLLQGALALFPRLAGVIGAGGEIGGFTICAEWRRPQLSPPKDRDFALGLGPVVVTPDELDPSGVEAVVRIDGEERFAGRFEHFEWEAARAHAAEGTTLRAGDLLVGPALEAVPGLGPGSSVELEISGIGVLAQAVAS